MFFYVLIVLNIAIIIEVEMQYSIKSSFFKYNEYILKQFILNFRECKLLQVSEYGPCPEPQKTYGNTFA
jgi:hypothetical protein